MTHPTVGVPPDAARPIPAGGTPATSAPLPLPATGFTPAAGGRRRSPHAPAIPRRRGEVLEDAIHTAVVELLAEHGYGTVTMDLVAARARAGKATLYRRWSCKLDLVIDTVWRLDNSCATDPDTGNFREDQLLLLHEFANVLRGRQGAVTATLVGELTRHADLAVALRTVLLHQRRAVQMAIAERAIKRGDVRYDAPWPLVNEIGPSLLFGRHLISGEPLDHRYIVDVVDGIVMPLVVMPTTAVPAAVRPTVVRPIIETPLIEKSR
ncbi:TetR/AcrR family transcriptional regulator [Frankia sp. Cas4]|uniref:TetR/AcrR family transcriptional regulator n=1 Tax=Frankia sp. Cas4 TaxID=3073927 RepID=UPI002AD1E606|nr:TetR/AcrR family transcriptional regulator [Frankia sp. Cas4]